MERTEDDVLAIEPRGDDGGDEELGAVGVLAGVSHRQETGLGVLQLEVLVGKLLAVDRLSTGAVSTGEVATLEHELENEAVRSHFRKLKSVQSLRRGSHGGRKIPCSRTRSGR